MKKLWLWMMMGVTTTAANAAVVVTRFPDYGVSLLPTGTTGIFRYEVDIDADGIYEVAFEANSGVEVDAISNSHVRIQAIPESPPDVGSDAWSLSAGSIIGVSPSSPALWTYEPIGSTMRVCTDLFCVGYWPKGTFVAVDPDTGFLTIFPESGYLAVEFTNATGLHYGWIDVGVLGFSPTARIYGWGWETQTGVAVQIVPETSSVLLMAAGVMAAVFRRKRKENQEV
jgi:hypothetical protein